MSAFKQLLQAHERLRWAQSRHRPLPPDTHFRVRQIRLFITELGREQL